jgi:hypothetical protein
MVHLFTAAVQQYCNKAEFGWVIPNFEEILTLAVGKKTWLLLGVAGDLKF